MMAAVKQFASRIEAQQWTGGVWIELQGAMRAPVRDGNVTLEPSWRADVFYNRRARKPDFVLIAKTPARLLRDLAALLDEQQSKGADS